MNRFLCHGFINENNKDTLYNTLSSRRQIFSYNSTLNNNPIKIQNTFKNKFSKDSKRNIIDSNSFMTIFNVKPTLQDNTEKKITNKTGRFDFLRENHMKKIEISKPIKPILPKIITKQSNTYRLKNTFDSQIIQNKDKKSLTFDKFNCREKKSSHQKFKLSVTSRFYNKNKKKVKIRKLDSYDIRTCPGSKNGVTKINQDSYIAMTKINNINNYKIFGVFDGHGYNGEDISQSVSNYFIQYYENTKFYDETPIHIFNDYKKDDYDLIRKCIINCNENLHKTLNCEKSGTTINTIHIINTKIINTNLGDSRTIFIDGNNKVIQLIKDHTPDSIKEKERIYEMGGEVSRVEWADYGPFRIWFKGENYPGLAMSRSLGDFDAEKIGVINIPEINDIDIVEKNIKICICASDGLWEFLSNDRVCELVLGYYNSDDVKGATRKLMEVARKTWEVNNNMGIDDITIIVLFFK